MSRLHHFKQAEKPEPAYGKAAERYSAEQRLGRIVAEMLAEPGMMDRDYVVRVVEFSNRAVGAARALGLLKEES